MKAFYVNRVADIGLTIGAIILGLTVGTFRFTEILEAAEAGLAALGAVAVAAGLLIFFGAMGKSAQIPAACLAARCHGRSDPGFCPDARGHHGHCRCLPDRPALSLL